MKEFICKIKNDEKITLKMLKNTYFSDNFYEVRAYNKEDKYIGYLEFEIIKNKGISDLRSIAVGDDYLNCGVGTCMLKLYEQFLLQNDVHLVFGVFYPHGAGEHLAPGFYIRHRYHILDDDGFLGLEKLVLKKDSNVPPLIEYDTTNQFAYAYWERRPQYEESEQSLSK